MRRRGLGASVGRWAGLGLGAASLAAGLLAAGLLVGGVRPAAAQVDAGAADADEAEGLGDGGTSAAALTGMVDEALRGLARRRNREGLKALEKGDHPAALAALTEAHELLPEDVEILNNLGFLHDRLGNREDAERLYRRTLARAPRRSVAHLNLADLLAAAPTAPERQTEAARLLVAARQLRGNQPGIIRRQARLAVARGLLDEAERHYGELASRATPADLLEIGDFHRDLGHPDEALAWYRRLVEPSAGPDGEGPSALQVALAAEAEQRIRQVRVDLQARRYGWSRGAVEVPARARALLARGEARLRQGAAAEAARLLAEAVSVAPTFAEAQAALGDALKADGQKVPAELAYLRAVAMEGGDAGLQARLAGFLAEQGRHAEAALFLERAVELRPDWTALHLQLARAWQAAGELPRALRQVELYLAGVPEDAPADEARALRQALRAALPQAALDGEDGGAAGAEDAGRSGAALARALVQARLHLGEGDPGRAMAALEGLAPEPEVLNLRGRVLRAAGQLPEARAAFEASLATRPEQPGVLMQLAEIGMAAGDEAGARARYAAAEAAGARAATLALARLDARVAHPGLPELLSDWRDLGRLRAAQDRVERYLAAAGERDTGDAEALRQGIVRRLRSVWLSLGGAGLALLLLLGLGLRRIFGGTDLAGLLKRHPETGPEVQRILSAVRHEVLKHNTLVLTGLVEAIEAGEPFAAEAAWARRSLLGAPGERGAECALQRLRGYADRLVQLGRAHDVRVNPLWADEALSALLEGFKALQRVAPLMDRAERLGPGGRRRLLRALKRAARLLNVEGYEAVRALLDRLRVLVVDAALIQTVFERTRGEPGLAGVAVAPLSLAVAPGCLPVVIAAPRHAFDDILTNLLRNALQSSLRHGPGSGAGSVAGSGSGAAAGTGGRAAPLRVGLAVDREVDFVTGLVRVVFAIQDASPQPLTPEMLRGRYIEAGLGLTADLVSRYEGTLDVRAEPAPWVKAVVVKLPAPEAEDEDADGDGDGAGGGAGAWGAGGGGGFSF